MQLEAAVYLHDVGMMLLPESVWLKVGRDGRRKGLAAQSPGLRRRPRTAHGRLGGGRTHDCPAPRDARWWRLSAGRQGDEICDGAKILAIVDAFEAVMLKHIHRGKNRSVLRAIAEINACDNQFAPEWIVPFNSVIRRTIEG